MSYAPNSKWNDKVELEALFIAKKLKVQNPKRGLQAELSRTLAAKYDMSWQTINAKVGNYKSLLGLIGPSNYSSNSKRVFSLYGAIDLVELEKLISTP